MEQDVIEETTFRIFGDVPHCLNQRDDILLRGRDEEILRTVLQRTREHDNTFNREKCQYGREKMGVEFFGHIFTKDGIETVAGQGQSNQRVWST